MNLLIVDNRDSFTYNLVQIFKQIGNCNIIFMKNEEITPLSQKRIPFAADNIDKILFTPGPGLPSDFPVMFDILKDHFKSKSILGVCLGHQAIAEFFGAKLINIKNVKHGMKANIDCIEQDILFKDIPKKFEVGVYHSWSVSKDNFPECLKITSISEDGIIMSLSHRSLNIHGVQFHPESIMTDFGKNIIENWIKS